MLINSEVKVWSFQCPPPSFSLLCPSRVWTASCALLWTWNWTCRCLGRDRPGWTESCTCCGSWRPSWRRRGSRARGSCPPGCEKTNASGSSSSRLRNRWVDFCLPERRRWGQEGVTLERFWLRLTRSSCRRSGWERCWGQQQRTSTRSGARAAKRCPKSRPSGERTVPVMTRRSFAVATAIQTSWLLLLLCFQREDGLLHTSKDQHPQPAGWRRVEKHFKVSGLSLTPLFPPLMKYTTGDLMKNFKSF